MTDVKLIGDVPDRWQPVLEIRQGHVRTDTGTYRWSRGLPRSFVVQAYIDTDYTRGADWEDITKALLTADGYMLFAFPFKDVYACHIPTLRELGYVDTRALYY